MRDRIDPELDLYFEYSNETWNSGFGNVAEQNPGSSFPYTVAEYQNGTGQTDWIMATAGSLPQAEFDATTCLTDAIACRDSYHGMRTEQMCTLVKAVLGSRAHCVFARQAADASKTTRALNCPLWTNAPNGDCHSEHDMILAIAPYFGGGSACGDATDVADLCSIISLGITANYHPTTGYLATNIAALDALSLNWPVIAYEAGSHASDTTSAVCRDAASTDDNCMETQLYPADLDAWMAHPRTHYRIEFGVNGRYVNLGLLFGLRGSMEGSYPKDDALQKWHGENKCWWGGDC